MPWLRTMTVSSDIAGNVGAARRAGAHDDGDLRDAGGRHGGLVVEDAPEVLAVGKHLGLQRQEGAAGVDEIDARQAVVARHFLRPQVLLDGEGKVGAALHGGVVGDDHHLVAVHGADAGDDTGAGRRAVIHVVGGQRREFKKRGAGIEQGVDALARQQFAALPVQGHGPLAAAFAHLAQRLAQALGLLQIARRVALEVGAFRVDA